MPKREPGPHRKLDKARVHGGSHTICRVSATGAELGQLKAGDG